MSNKKEELIFISRHDPNDGQVAVAQKLGYDGIKKVEVKFSDDPKQDLLDAGIEDKIIGIVAPSYVSNKLMNEGYKLIEFVNSPITREKRVFCCDGAYKYWLSSSGIEQEFFSCPISIDDQYESSLD